MFQRFRIVHSQFSTNLSRSHLG